MLVDLLIVVFGISAVFRGREIGFVRQLCSTVGFFVGLFLGAWLEHYTIQLANSQDGKVLVALVTTLGCALLFLTIGEYVGVRLKSKVLLKRINSYDNGFGSVLSVITLLISAWLIAAILVTLPLPSLQSAVNRSRIIGELNRVLPSAPKIITGFGNLIDPNGFPQVFIGQEPSPPSNVTLPDLGSLQAAVDSDKASVVKVEGRGCGGIVEGSGFVVGSDLVATNAHVVAGIKHPFAQDANGTHSASVIWFDPNLDFAVLRVSNLAGKSLLFNNSIVANGTASAVLGYPGGGPFTAKPAAILDQFKASGRNIYGAGAPSRSVYEIQADVIPGNSGGPLVTKDGSVIGVVFAESTAYQHVGYALTANQVSSELKQAISADEIASTGQCAE